MYRYNLHEGNELGLGLSRILDLAKTHGGGPKPKIVAKDMRPVYQTKMEFIALGGPSNPIVAIPLLTCAAVAMISTHQDAPPRGVIYHALSGSTSDAKIGEMHSGLGSPPKDSLLALYVVTNKWDDNYQNDAMNLEKYGIPADSVAYIADFPFSYFGMNHMGQVGY